MGGFLKKAGGFIKILLSFLLENWTVITPFFSSVTIAGIIAGLGRFFGFFARLMESSVNIRLWIVIAISPFLIYGVVMPVIGLIKALKKPSYLKTTGMEYKKWKLKWDYSKNKTSKKYNIINIRPVCHKCGCRLLEHHTTTGIDGMYCPVCEEDNKYVQNLYPSFFTETTAAKTVIEHETIEKI